MPDGDRMISDDQIRKIAVAIPNGVHQFLLTCKRDLSEISHQVREAGTDSLQLVDRVEISDLIALRRELPGIALVQVVHVTGPPAIAEAEEVAARVDYILLDSGAPDAPSREFGGTGRTHDWATSAEIVRRVRIPVFLAGGLGPDNVADAIRQVRPYGVDVCSRLRPNGYLDEGLLAGFFEAVESATAA
jgi:phosphoribosylanthranilate isomerase